MFIRYKLRKGKKDNSYSFYCCISKNKKRKDIFLFTIKFKELKKNLDKITFIEYVDAKALYVDKLLEPLETILSDRLYDKGVIAFKELLSYKIDELKAIIKEDEELRRAREEQAWEDARSRERQGKSVYNKSNQEITIAITLGNKEELDLFNNMIKEGYKRLAHKLHPDRNGDLVTMQKLNDIKEKLEI